MVEVGTALGTRRARQPRVTEGTPLPSGRRPRVWVVEDEPATAALAAELCDGWGADATIFRAPLPYLSALRDRKQPTIVVLDWRLEHELSAALYLATRHRYPSMPVVYWTAHPLVALPAMIRDDPLTTIVDKAVGAGPFEQALDWAVARVRSGEAREV